MAISTIGVNGIASSGLNASALTTGTLPVGRAPSGSVIQTVYTPYGTSVATNSSSPTAIGPQISITTTVANSKIIVSLSSPCQLLNTSDVQYNVAWRNSTDNYTNNTSVYPAVISGGWYELPSHFSTVSNPSAAAGTTITYKLYVNKVSGTGYIYLIDAWNTSAGGLMLTAMEIAP
jgi:hypothetical protein